MRKTVFLCKAISITWKYGWNFCFLPQAEGVKGGSPLVGFQGEALNGVRGKALTFYRFLPLRSRAAGDLSLIVGGLSPQTPLGFRFLAKARRMAPPPPPPRLLKKAGENFCFLPQAEGVKGGSPLVGFQGEALNGVRDKALK